MTLSYGIVAFAALLSCLCALWVRAFAQRTLANQNEQAMITRTELERQRAIATGRIDAARVREQLCRNKLAHLFRVRELVKSIGCSIRVQDTLSAIGFASRETLGARHAAIRFRLDDGSVQNFILNPHPVALSVEEAAIIWSAADAPGVVTRDLRGSRGESILLDFRDRDSDGYGPHHRAISRQAADRSDSAGLPSKSFAGAKDGVGVIDEDAVDILASITGVSLEKALLFQKVETMAQIDAVTGLYNRRSLDEILKTEWGRASHLRQPRLNCLMT